MYGELTLREALAVGLLERFVRQEESRGGTVEGNRWKDNWNHQRVRHWGIAVGG